MAADPDLAAVRVLFSIHNLSYQGLYPEQTLGQLGLPASLFQPGQMEFYGRVNLIKAGLSYSDRLSTVSPTYAREIQSDEGGMGLGGLLRQRAGVLSGILNGIDVEVWNPQTDPHIAYRFGAGDLSFRAANKAVLQQQFNLDSSDEAPLLGVISRLSWQKGLDLLLQAIPTLLGQGMQLALLGSGDRDLQDAYQAAARAHPGRIGVVIGYDEILAHLIQAGADALIVPSRFEPCGLTQLCALRYGAVPIVSRVGGLEDTIVDVDEAGASGRDATGFKFAPVTTEALVGSLRKARETFRDKASWRRLQLDGLATDVSWRHRAGDYAALYRDLVGARRPA